MKKSAFSFVQFSFCFEGGQSAAEDAAECGQDFGLAVPCPDVVCEFHAVSRTSARHLSSM